MILSEQEIDDISRDWYINIPTGYDLKWAIIKSHREQSKLIAEQKKRIEELEHQGSNHSKIVYATWDPRNYFLSRKYLTQSHTLISYCE